GQRGGGGVLLRPRGAHHHSRGAAGVGHRRRYLGGGPDVLGRDAADQPDVAAGLGGAGHVTGLYYAISVLTDAVYRSDFVDEMVAKMADVTAHRAVYHQLL